MTDHLPEPSPRPTGNVSPFPPVRYTITPTLMTPERAAELLGKMKLQRRLRKQTLKKLHRIVDAGQWKMMPHGIVVSTDGVVLDGQHRLRVIADSGRAQWVLLIEGCPPDYYYVIDNAMVPKNAEDALRGVECDPGLIFSVAMAGRLLWRRERLDRVDPNRGGTVDKSEFVRDEWPTNEELLALYQREESTLKEAALLAQRAREWCRSPGTFAYALQYGLRLPGYAPQRTREFAEAVRTGLNLEEGDPAVLLRNSWMKEHGSGVRRYEHDIFIQVAVTLSDFIRGRSRKTWRRVEFGPKAPMPVVGR